MKVLIYSVVHVIKGFAHSYLHCTLLKPAVVLLVRESEKLGTSDVETNLEPVTNCCHRVTTQNIAVEWLASLFRIWRFRIQISVPKPAILTEVSHGFLRSVQINSAMLH
jgi:hypothetical protein